MAHFPPLALCWNVTEGTMWSPPHPHLTTTLPKCAFGWQLQTPPLTFCERGKWKTGPDTTENEKPVSACLRETPKTRDRASSCYLWRGVAAPRCHEEVWGNSSGTLTLSRAERHFTRAKSMKLYCCRRNYSETSIFRFTSRTSSMKCHLAHTNTPTHTLATVRSEKDIGDIYCVATVVCEAENKKCLIIQKNQKNINGTSPMRV